MTDSRKKGLNYVREVRKILQAMEHQVEGPGYGLAFFGGSPRPIHRDYFGLYDLVSCYDGRIYLHQVTDLSNKAKKVKAIQEKKIPGWVWARCDGGKIFYRIFCVDMDGRVEESQIRWRLP